VKTDDLVVGFVRRPDPEPCYACARDEWDACRNGQYTEHGIKELDGFMREFYRADPEALVRIDQTLGKLGVLLEPTTVVAKAWEQVEKVGSRSEWEPETVVIVGAGPIGLLAALLARQRGLEVHVIDRVTTGIKPDLVRDLGATYHTGLISDVMRNPDVIIECTGVPSLVFDSIDAVGPSGVVCLTGVSAAGHKIEVDGGAIGRGMVLGNKVVVGSVNANRRHYAAGADALAKADKEWLGRLITRSVPMEQFHEALEHGTDDVKVVVEIAAS
jgi:threonine dehydrogenase-like Zn-dependent dehydrogenase